MKCLITTLINGRELLLSGCADSKIVVWDVGSGERLQLLRTGHTTGGVLALALYPANNDTPRLEGDGQDGRDGTQSSKAETTDPALPTILSAGSDRTIRRYFFFPSTTSTILEEIHPNDPIIVHDTSINALTLTNDPQTYPTTPDNPTPSPRVWTASADGFAICLLPTSLTSPTWKTEASLNHGGYVRAVTVDTEGGWVITAGRSEEIKIWDAETGELEWSYEGHYDEVTGLVVLDGRREVVSISYDGTVRRWGLKGEVIEGARRRAREEEERREKGEADEVEGEEVNEGDERLGLTEEEERELAELMEEG